MPTTEQTWNKFQGLLPAVDAVQPQAPFVVNGANFMLDVQGPYSTFYSRIMTYAQLAIPAGSFTFRTQNDLIIATTGCILRYDSTTMRYYPVYTFNDPGIIWPWSFANIDNKYYLTKKGIGGVLQYDALANSWTLLTSFMPTGVVGLCSAYGRLIVLGDSDVAWSAQDDGTNMVPDLTSGAGFQGTSLVGGAGYPIAVLETTDGFITYTAKGCMKSTFVNAVGTPWQHTVLTKNYMPLSPFLAVQTADLEHIILDRKGLFSTNGAQFQPYAPMFSEYLQKTLLKNLGPIVNYPVLQLYWYDSAKFLFLSVASQASPQLFSKAFVYYSNVDGWGSFDQFHYGFGELNNTSSPNIGYNFGYLDTFGYYRLFIDDAIIEAKPDKNAYYFYQPVFDLPVTVINNGSGALSYIANSMVHITEIDESILTHVSGGMYALSALAVGPEPVNYNPGPDFSAFTTSATYEDWKLIPDGIADEDYSLEVDQIIDWGGTDYGIAASSTLSMASEVDEVTSMSVPLVISAPSSFVEIGLLKIIDGTRSDQLSMVTDVTVQCDQYPGFPVFDDYMLGYTPDITEDWNTIPNNTADENWGNQSPYLVAFTASVISTIDGNSVFENNSFPLTLERFQGEHRYYSCMSIGPYHKFRFDANQVGQSYHVKLLDITGTLAGNIA